MEGKVKDVYVGDLLRKTNSTNWVWQVTEFVAPHGHQPHVRLVRVNNPTDSRVFALAALQDRRFFVNANQPRRRIEAPLPIQWGRSPEAGTSP